MGRRRSGTPPSSAWSARRAAHGSYGEFSAKFASGVAEAPFLADPLITKGEPGTLALPAAADGVDVYGWAHNETSTGVMAPIARPHGADNDALVLIDATSGAGGLPVDIDQTDVYYFAPQKAFAADGGLWLAIMSRDALDRVAEIKASKRWIPGFLDLTDRHRQLAARPDLQHARGGDAVPARRPGEVAARPRWPQRRRGPHAGLVEPALRVGGEVAVRERRSSPTPTSGPTSSAPSTSTSRWTRPQVAKVLRANGVVDIEPYRKLGRNQLRVGMFPAVDPDDVSALTASIDYVVERL